MTTMAEEKKQEGDRQPVPRCRTNEAKDGAEEEREPSRGAAQQLMLAESEVRKEGGLGNRTTSARKRAQQRTRSSCAREQQTSKTEEAERREDQKGKREKSEKAKCPKVKIK